MNFFLDRNLSRQLIRIFQSAGLNAVHHDQVFCQDTKDPEIIEYIATNNLVLVTYDTKMFRTHAAALKANLPYIIFVSDKVGSKTAQDQMVWYHGVGIPVFLRLRQPPPTMYVWIGVGGDTRVDDGQTPAPAPRKRKRKSNPPHVPPLPVAPTDLQP